MTASDELGTFDARGHPPEQIVAHIDMDCFYAACERLREPKLGGEPVIVGMGYDSDDRSGAVATASYEARKHGVESAQPISTACQRLPPRSSVSDDSTPTAYYRPVDMDYYKAISSDLMTVLRGRADVLRAVGIDEAYLEVTTRTSWETAEAYGHQLKDEIARRTRLPASVGIAPTMSAAKIASDHEKPDGLVVVPPNTLKEFLAPIAIEEIHGVGPVRADEFSDIGVQTAGDLQEADSHTITERFGDIGRDLYNRVHGVDLREVKPVGEPKSLSRETSIDPSVDEETKRALIHTLAGEVAERARLKGARYRTIGIKVVTLPYDVHTRARSLPGPIDDPAIVDEMAGKLLEEFITDEVRKLGVRVSNLDFSAGSQVRLSEWAVAEAETSGLHPSVRLGQTRLSDFTV